LPDDICINMDPTKTTELNRFIEVGAASSGMRTSFLSEDT